MSTSNISVNQEAADPTPLLFIPQGADDGKVEFTAVGSGSVPLADAKLITSYSPQGGTLNVRTTLVQPLERTDADGNVTIAGTARKLVTYILPDVMTATEKTEFVYAGRNLDGSSEVDAYLAHNPMV
jgi:hypothetical protein